MFIDAKDKKYDMSLVGRYVRSIKSRKNTSEGVKKTWEQGTVKYKNRTATMLKKYGKGSGGPKTIYSFGEPGWSAEFFMKKNKRLVLKLIDHSKPTNNKYHKIHKLLIEHCIGEQPSSATRRHYIARFVSQNGR